MHDCMDSPTRSFDWNRARSFLAVAEEGSLSAAARVLASTQPTVGRHVSALEAELGVVLFERIGTTLSLTPVGLELAEHVRTMSAAADRVSRVAAGHSQEVEGVVRITASDLIAAYLLPPVLRRLRAEHPGILVDIVASNATLDLQRREADLALRNFPPTTPELVARSLGTRRARFYGTPAYLAAVGLTGRRAPAELARADLISFPETDVVLGWLQSQGVPVERRHLAVVCDVTLVQWELCRAGLGLAVVMEAVGDADPAVQRVDVDMPPVPVPIFLTAHRELRTSRRLRVVWDRLAEALADAPA